MPELRATARVQLHADFNFAAATEQVPYYAALGISHLYLSPIAQARAGSRHGYDVVDHGRINPELGGEPGLRALVEALRRHGMGSVLDIVPNHMAADTANPWWRDVLAQGRGSAYADHFDIDWDAPEQQGRVLLPVLERGVDHALRSGALRLAADEDSGEPALLAGDQRYPLSADGLHWLAQALHLSGEEGLRAQAAREPLRRLLATLDEDARAGGGRLRELLDLQHYRLVWWRRGNDEINYRRFFDITGLAGVCVERAQVFDDVHALPLRLIAEGLVDGLRIDHVDGLGSPRAYLGRLRRRVEAARRQRSDHLRGPIPIYVEKILAHDEALPADWPVDGSTGYDFMDQAAAVLHDPAGEIPLRRAWAACSGGRANDFDKEERLARRYLLGASLQADYAACARAWHAFARHQPDGREFTTHALARGLAELLEQLRVYRTYLGPAAPTAADRAALEHAADAARHYGDPDRAEVRDYLLGQLLGRELRTIPAGAPRRRYRNALRRFEQLAAPLNAKSVEDTGFYRYGVLLSRNEVGSDPRRFALEPEAFHAAARRRGERHPRALLATATHDHKRGEDTRLRLAVLSERAEGFAGQAPGWIERWRALLPAAPAAEDLWMLLQTLLAAWPLALDAGDEAGLAAYAGRLAEWQLKAIREAKLHTRWTAPEEAYEQACRQAIERLFASAEAEPLRRELAAAAHALDAPGALNGLVQCALRLTVPGVPDLYQGTERWDQSLVDPDNRRPVDYALRRAGPPADADPAALLAGYRSGAVKQWLIARLLEARRQHPALFAEGSYEPLAAHGRHAGRVLAFARRHGGEHWIVVLPRLCAALLESGGPPQVPAERWADTAVSAAGADEACTWDELFTGTVHRQGGSGFALAALLARWPLAVLRLRKPVENT